MGRGKKPYMRNRGVRPTRKAQVIEEEMHRGKRDPHKLLRFVKGLGTAKDSRNMEHRRVPAGGRRCQTWRQLCTQGLLCGESAQTGDCRYQVVAEESRTMEPHVSTEFLYVVRPVPQTL